VIEAVEPHHPRGLLACACVSSVTRVRAAGSILGRIGAAVPGWFWLAAASQASVTAPRDERLAISGQPDITVVVNQWDGVGSPLTIRAFIAEGPSGPHQYTS
jgi:hypothetical protein